MGVFPPCHRFAGVASPHPFRVIARVFQRTLGRPTETRALVDQPGLAPGCCPRLLRPRVGSMYSCCSKRRAALSITRPMKVGRPYTLPRPVLPRIPGTLTFVAHSELGTHAWNRTTVPTSVESCPSARRRGQKQFTDGLVLQYHSTPANLNGAWTSRVSGLRAGARACSEAS